MHDFAHMWNHTQKPIYALCRGDRTKTVDTRHDVGIIIIILLIDFMYLIAIII